MYIYIDIVIILINNNYSKKIKKVLIVIIHGAANMAKLDQFSWNVRGAKSWIRMIKKQKLRPTKYLQNIRRVYFSKTTHQILWMIFTINLDVTSIDNTDGNVAFTCKRFYALVLIRELEQHWHKWNLHSSTEN